MKKIYATLFVLFFIGLHVKAQSGNMWTEIPYGQNIYCVHAEGDFIWFGTNFGIVKYNRLTGDKKYITFFNTFHDLMPGWDYNGPFNCPTSITSDSLGNIYALVGHHLLKYDGIVWQDLAQTFYQNQTSQISKLKIAGNKIWVYLFSTDIFAGTGVYLNEYYDLNTNVIDTIPYTVSTPLHVNDDGTYWAVDNNYTGGIFGDSSHIIKRDLSGNIFDSRYVHTYFDQTYAQSCFFASNSSGTIFYFDTNGFLCSNNGTTVTQFVYPVNNYLVPVAETFDASGNLYILNCDMWFSYFGFMGSPQDSSVLVRFNGSSASIYNSSQIGNPNHRFSNMDFDDDGNLWLSCYQGQYPANQENVFKKTPANSWSSFYLNDNYLPGMTAGYRTAMGSDNSGNSYFGEDGVVAIVDSNFNTSFIQYYDTLTGGVGLYDLRKAVSPNGTVWVCNGTYAYKLFKIENGISSSYNLPSQFNYSPTVRAVSNAGVFVAENNYQSPCPIFFFDGSNWTQIPATGIPLNFYPNSKMTFDELNNKLWYSIRDSLTGQIGYMSWNGSNNSYLGFSIFPSGYYPPQFEADDIGNVWFLNVNTNGDSSLMKWDGNSATYHNAPSALQYFQIVDAFGGHIRLKAVQLNPYNYHKTEFIYDFDGTNWIAHELPDNTNFTQNQSTLNPDAECVFSNGKYLFQFENEIAVFDPDGSPNLPGLSYNFVNGNVFYDMNSNGIYNTGDLKTQGITVHSDNYSCISNWFGNFELHTDTGTQNIQTENVPYYISSPANYIHDFHDSVSLGINLIDFALQPVPGINDLNLDISSWGFRPGDNGYYFLHYKNSGTTIQNASLTLNFDNQLSYVSSNQNPVSINGNTVTWNLGSLNPFQQGTIYAWLFVDSSIAIGTGLNSAVQITPVANDTTPLNNTVNYSHIVTASWDPNEKQVSPQGIGAGNVIDTSQELTYTIFFQNTGTDTAFNITVFDTLDTNLDVGSFRLISSSHQVQFYFQNPNIMNFDFENILLPDSNNNEPASHGFVKYSIKPKSETQYGSTIQNTGYIYFDYNSPVVTNTTLNTLGPLSIFEVNDFNQLNLKLFPNPNDGHFTIELLSSKEYENLKLEITDCTGRIIEVEPFIENKISVDSQNFSAGIYFAKILSKEKIIGAAKYVQLK